MGRTTLEAGSYLAADAARLVGVPGDRIGQWARWGHIAASVSAREPHVYSWGDVAEALAVHVLLGGGVGLPAIRRAVEVIGGRWPLSRAGVHLVDGRIAVERSGGLEDVFSEQRVLAADGGPEVEPVEVWVTVDAAARLARGGWTQTDAVVVDPARAGGRPCVKGTRVAVADLAADPSQSLGLDPGLRRDALAWWAASDPGGPGTSRPDADRARALAQRRAASRAVGARGGRGDGATRAAGARTHGDGTARAGGARGGRALVVDAGLAPALAEELDARGREAYTLPGALADAEVAALDGVVVTTDAATWALCPCAVLVPPGAPGRDAVHRHAHELVALRGRRTLR